MTMHDATDWKNFLNGQGYNVVLLTDRQATANAIEAKIDTLLADEDADDYVVFTYSGHGTTYRNYGSCMISTDMVYLTHGWLESKFDSSLMDGSNQSSIPLTLRTYTLHSMRAR